MNYFIVKEVLGYTIGLADEFNPAPKDSIKFENEAEANKFATELDEQVMKDLDSLSTPVFNTPEEEEDKNIDLANYISENFKVPELKAFLKANKVSGYSRLNEAGLIQMIFDNNLEQEIVKYKQ